MFIVVILGIHPTLESANMALTVHLECFFDKLELLSVEKKGRQVGKADRHHGDSKKIVPVGETNRLCQWVRQIDRARGNNNNACHE